MKVICLQENLKNNLGILERISSKNSTMPILNHTLLKTEDGFLKTFATDLEIGVEIQIPCKIESKGEVVLPVKLLLNFINNLPTTKITIKSDNGKVILEGEGLKTNIPTLNKDDFPIIPKIKPIHLITINPNILKTSLSQVLNSTAISPSIPEISGILFNFQQDILKIVSTDSFRLSEKIIYQKDNYTIKDECKFILPQKTANELIRSINQIEDIEIELDQNQILFKLKNINIISRIITGEYPNYEQIIPKKTKTNISLDKNDFMAKIKLASLFSSKINDVKFIINPDDGILEIQSSSPDKGEFNSIIKTEINGEGFEVVFNYKYILDGLNNIYDDEIIFEMNGPASPSIIKSKTSNYNYVVMPIKT